MGIEAKCRGWEIGKIKIDVYKIMTSEGSRNIKSLGLEIFMPLELDPQEYKVLQDKAEEFPVKLNIEDSINMILNWH